MKRLACLLIFICLLCGCSAAEPDEKYLVSAVGVEQNAEEVTLYYKITDFGNEVNQNKILSSKGKSIVEAAEGISLRSALKPSLYHTEVVFVSPYADKEIFSELFSFLNDSKVSLKVRLAVTDGMAELFSEDNTFSGETLSGMLESVSKAYGFGGHTALFEIETAMDINGGDFALPWFGKGSEGFGVEGLALYKNALYTKRLGVKESVEYAKDEGISEEEGA